MSRSCVVRLTFLEQCLGTLPSNEQIYRDYIATKNQNRTQKIVEEEVTALAPEEPGRPVTTFARVPDKKGNPQPAIKGYVLKGMFKNACQALRDCDDTLSSQITAYKKFIDQKIFVNVTSPSPYSIINVAGDVYKDGKLPILERPLRASTPQGERVALTASEYVPEASTIDFQITALNDAAFALVFEWLDYGMLNGLGCWHNAGQGRFTYEIISGDKKPDDVVITTKKPRAKKAAAEEEIAAEDKPKRGRPKKNA